MSHSASLPTSRMTVTNRRFLGGVFAFMLSATAVIHAAPLSWNTSGGDVFLGFESTSLNLDYVVDLGQGSTLAAQLTNGTFSSLNLNADLTTVFGSGWYTNSAANVQWGLFGLPSSKSIVYASVPHGNTAPITKTTGSLGNPYTHNYAALGNGYNADIANNQGLTKGVEQFVGTGSDTGYATWTGNNTPSTQPFTAYNKVIETGIEGYLDFYGTTTSTSTLLAELTVSGTGILNAVPEPSTYALFGIAFLFFLIAYRRRRAESMN